MINHVVVKVINETDGPGSNLSNQRSSFLPTEPPPPHVHRLHANILNALSNWPSRQIWDIIITIIRLEAIDCAVSTSHPQSARTDMHIICQIYVQQAGLPTNRGIHIWTSWQKLADQAVRLMQRRIIVKGRFQCYAVFKINFRREREREGWFAWLQVLLSLSLLYVANLYN